MYVYNDASPSFLHRTSLVVVGFSFPWESEVFISSNYLSVDTYLAVVVHLRRFHLSKLDQYAACYKQDKVIGVAWCLKWSPLRSAN